MTEAARLTGIDGRRALVTGGASGIGSAIAHRLASRGAQVCVLDLPGDNLQRAADGGMHVVAADVRDRTMVLDAVSSASRTLGGLDTLVLCAGIIHIKPLAEVTEADWDSTLDVNLKGAFLVAQAAAPALVESGRGRIVAISSDAGRNGVPFLHAYSASKAGLIGLTQAMAAELAPHVTVNSLCPVSTPDTTMGREVMTWKKQATHRTDDEVLDDIRRVFPMARTGTADDIAAATEFLVSDGAGFITGVALDVDGGAALNSMPGAAS